MQLDNLQSTWDRLGQSLCKFNSSQTWLNYWMNSWVLASVLGCIDIVELKYLYKVNIYHIKLSTIYHNKHLNNIQKNHVVSPSNIFFNKDSRNFGYSVFNGKIKE